MRAVVDSGDATHEEEPGVDDEQPADLAALRAAVDGLRADVAELRSGLEQAGLDSERRVVARVDEAALVLAEALLRPRRPPVEVVHEPVDVPAGDATTPVLPEPARADVGAAAGDPVHAGPAGAGGRRRPWWRPRT